MEAHGVDLHHSVRPLRSSIARQHTEQPIHISASHFQQVLQVVRKWVLTVNGQLALTAPPTCAICSHHRFNVFCVLCDTPCCEFCHSQPSINTLAIPRAVCRRCLEPPSFEPTDQEREVFSLLLELFGPWYVASAR